MKKCIALAAALLPLAAHAVDPKEAKCLATTIYGEARGESVKGMIAVAYTLVNRAVDKTVCQVALEPMQYSVYNDNPALRAAAMSLKIAPRQNNAIDMISWQQAQQLAISILRKDIPDPTKGATHYLNPVLVKQLGYQQPDWVPVFQRTAVIENHHFYKIDPVKYNRWLAKKLAAEKKAKEEAAKLAAQG